MTQRSNSTGSTRPTSLVRRIDAIGLQRLRATFDTTELLRAVDALDSVRAVLANPDELRADLLRLHGMAHTLINGGALSATSLDETLAELAADIEAELERMSALLLTIRQRIQPLLTLAPEDD